MTTDFTKPFKVEQSN